METIAPVRQSKTVKKPDLFADHDQAMKVNTWRAKNTRSIFHGNDVFENDDSNVLGGSICFMIQMFNERHVLFLSNRVQCN